MQLIAVALLAVIELIHPVPILLIIRRLLVRLRVESLGVALNRLKELEAAEERERTFQSFTPDEAKAEIVDWLRFELIACAYSIRYWRRRLDEPEADTLDEDLIYFRNLVAQRAEVTELEPIFVRCNYLEMLQERVSVATERFDLACDVYFA